MICFILLVSNRQAIRQLSSSLFIDATNRQKKQLDEIRVPIAIIRQAAPE